MWDKSFELPNNGLRAYFGRVVHGQDKEFRTTFYKGETLSTVVQNWLDILEPVKREWPTLWDFESDMASKVGPMSIMKPLSERMPSIEAYYTDVRLPSRPVDSKAIEAALKEWQSIRGLRLRSAEHVLEEMRLDTNSGSPFFTRRSRVVGNTSPCTIERIDESVFVMHMPTGDYTATAILGWRGQEGGPDVDDIKQRVIFMFPFAANIAELSAYQPLIASMQQGTNPLVPAWVGNSAVDKSITKLFDTKPSKQVIVCTDFTKFDQHFNSDMQNCAHDCLAGLFTNNRDFMEWTDNVFPVKYNIPLAIDWETMLTGAHGMGSGSGGTNADETLAHKCLQHEAAIHSGSVLNPWSMCLGDDGLLTYKGIDVKHVLDTYTSHGLEMNSDKQYVSSEDCVYLRRWHHRDYRVGGVCAGVYSTARALGRLCEQERFYDPKKWGPKMVALRQISILQNVEFHPYKEKFVDYCIAGDKYRLGIDIPGFLDEIDVIANEANTQMPDFMSYSAQQEGIKGIGNWWIVKYLKSKA